MSQTDPNNIETKNYQEELTVFGDQLLTRVRELVREGNVRRIIIKQEGHTILEIPLTVGVVGVLVAPALAAIGAIGALIAQCSIEVIRSERPGTSASAPFDAAEHTKGYASQNDVPPTI